MKARRFSTTIRRGLPSTHEIPTGWYTFFTSHACGCGRRSADTSPFTRKFPSLRIPAGPKSPPYAQYSRPRSSVARIAWSTQSQMNPPCSCGCASITAQ